MIYTNIIMSAKNAMILESVDSEIKSFTKWFLAITEIPHETYKAEALIAKICEWIAEMGVPYERDDFGNIVARIGPNKMSEKAPVVAIQAHTDMVSVGKFNADGSVNVSLENGVLVANESTLGADDGFGLALMLDMIEHRTEFVHGPMEFIFTSDEEQGLVGVKKLPRADGSTSSPISPMKFNYLINCDSLNGDRIYIGSNGGTVYDISMEISRTLVDEAKCIVEIELKGLKGGHSGACINMNRMSAIKAIVKILKYLERDSVAYELCDFQGGEQMNTIPRFASCKIAVSEENAERAVALIKSHCGVVFNEVKLTENTPDFRVSVQKVTGGETCIAENESKRLINFILCYKDGPLRMSPAFPEFVDASDNLAVVNMQEKFVNFISFARSATQSKLDETDATIRALCAMSGFNHTVNARIAGAPWTPDVTSKLAAMMAESFKEVNGIEKPLGLVQVTIEPAEFTKLGYTADMISICPSIPKAHTVGEYVDLGECARWRNAIYHTLAKLCN